MSVHNNTPPETPEHYEHINENVFEQAIKQRANTQQHLKVPPSLERPAYGQPTIFATPQIRGHEPPPRRFGDPPGPLTLPVPKQCPDTPPASPHGSKPNSPPQHVRGEDFDFTRQFSTSSQSGQYLAPDTNPRHQTPVRQDSRESGYYPTYYATQVTTHTSATPRPPPTARAPTPPNPWCPSCPTIFSSWRRSAGT
jgi:hypothetical protein